MENIVLVMVLFLQIMGRRVQRMLKSKKKEIMMLINESIKEKGINNYFEEMKEDMEIE